MESNFAPHQKNEEAIVRKLIEDALAADYRLSVNDGGEMVVTKSQDPDEVLAAMNSTDEDFLHFHTAKDAYIGWVSLIWGNDTDVISDCTDNEATLAVLRGAEQLAEELGDAA